MKPTNSVSTANMVCQKLLWIDIVQHIEINKILRRRRRRRSRRRRRRRRRMLLNLFREMYSNGRYQC
jgi:hypothetical protein